MIAALALMDTPAIIVSLYLARKYMSPKNTITTRFIFHEALLNGSIFLLLGSLCIGIISGSQGMITLKPFISDIFKGMLCFFLLDMGIVAAKKIIDLRKNAHFLIPFAMLIPLVNATISLMFAYLLNVSVGNTFLLTVLAASASYIAVPAVVRISIPEANPGLYIPLALGITFPFNIVVGLPLYMYIIQYFW